MNITRNNYESYFLDYLDGTLDAGDGAELENFLSENPDLKAEIDSFQNIVLEAVTEKYSGKEDLKKEIGEKYFDISEFEYLSIAKIENDISEKDNEKLNRLLSNSPENKSDFEYFKRTKLQPDLSIVFEKKARIKKFTIITDSKRLIKSSIAAAAVAAVFTGSVLYFNHSRVYQAAGFQSLKSTYSVKQSKTGESKSFKIDASKEIALHQSDFQKIENEATEKDSSNKADRYFEPDSNYKFASNAKIESIENITTETDFREFYTEVSQLPEEEKKQWMWVVAENAVKFWNFSTNGKINMKNKYDQNGRIQQLTVYTSNFKFSKKYKNF